MVLPAWIVCSGSTWRETKINELAKKLQASSNMLYVEMCGQALAPQTCYMQWHLSWGKRRERGKIGARMAKRGEDEGREIGREGKERGRKYFDQTCRFWMAADHSLNSGAYESNCVSRKAWHSATIWLMQRWERRGRKEEGRFVGFWMAADHSLKCRVYEWNF